MIAVTGSTGQLGRLVLTHLLARMPASSLVALARDPSKASDLKRLGVAVRQADYDDPSSLDTALAGVGTLLLISSSEVGKRTSQHLNVIDAALRQRVARVAYTSVLKANSTTLSLAPEHLATEAYLAQSGLSFTVLRNGWYTENYTASLAPSLAHGVLLGSAGQGRIAAASREDYAEAAAAVLVAPFVSGRILELAGDESFTLSDLATEVARQTGKPFAYKNLPEAEYAGALKSWGLPDWLATGLANWDVSVSKGDLDSSSRELSRWLGRPSTPMRDTVRSALAAAGVAVEGRRS